MSRFTVHACLAGALLAGLGTPPRSAAGGEPTAENAGRAGELVVQLGDPDFQVREAASARLIELGPEAHAVLLAGENDPDPEIRFRCKRILDVIEYDSRERRYQEFLSKSNAGKPLGGWDRFQRVVGDNEAARKLFVEMHRSEWDLLETVVSDPKLAHEKFSQRCEYLRESSQMFRQQLPLGSVVTIIFLASEEDLRVSEFASSIVYTFCYQDSFRGAIEEGPNKAHLRTLLGAWVSANTGITTAYQGLMLALRYDLKEGLPAAKKVLAEPGMPPHYKQFAILAVVKLGSAEDLPTLAKFLDDPAPCGAMTVAKGNERVILQTQLRDVALAAVIHLSGQDLSDFGFPHAQENEQMVYNVNTLGFEDDKQREESRKKWDQFRARQPGENAAVKAAGETGDEP